MKGTLNSAPFISVEACAAMHQPRLVDVRSATEYAAGHIARSLNIPLDELQTRTADIAVEGPVVLVCQSGQRAKLGASFLAALGMETLVLEGGLRNWTKTGMPLVSSKRTRWSLERQVRFGAGLLILTSFILAKIFGAAWLALAAFAGAGLTFAGATDVCLFGNLLSRMPWNQSRPATGTELNGN